MPINAREPNWWWCFTTSSSVVWLKVLVCRARIDWDRTSDWTVIKLLDTRAVLRRNSGSHVSSTAASKQKLSNDYDVARIFNCKLSVMTWTASAIGSLSVASTSFKDCGTKSRKQIKLARSSTLSTRSFSPKCFCNNDINAVLFERLVLIFVAVENIVSWLLQLCKLIV